MTDSSTAHASDTVLVTGATGFIAQHCMLQLLEAGYRVRGTARSAGRTAEVADVLRPHLSDAARAGLADRFEVVAADLTADAGWDEAVAGCRYVLHVASPIPRTPPKNPDELIVPARDGALRVLRAASSAGVERVVLTSSVAAVLYGRDRNRVFTEDDWSNIDDKRIGTYEKSKAIAERAAWDAMGELGSESTMSLAVINPGLVLGPLLSSDWGTSGEAVKKLIDRDFPAIPDIHYACVDVRDVAAAHVAAMTAPGAAGQRFICAEADHSLREIASILATHLGPKGFKVPTGKLPGPVLKVVALWDKTAQLALNDLGVRQDIDNAKIRRVLGWQPRGLEEMVVSMADSMIEHGIVKAGK
jgi:nucleoside-diphosphate-sugar epimerase